MKAYSHSAHHTGQPLDPARLLHSLEQHILLGLSQSSQEGQGMFWLLTKFCRDERGFVPATEWMLVTSILTLGTIAAIWSVHAIDDRRDDSPVALVCSELIQK